MWTQDFVRVLQGASKVAEQVAHSQGPEVAAKTQKLSRHASELSRLVPYFLQGERTPSAASAPAPPEPPKPQQKNPELLKHQTLTPKPETPRIQVPTEFAKTQEPIVKIQEPNVKTQEPNVKTQEPNVKTQEKDSEPAEAPPRVWEEKHVPSSPLSRILGFGGLAAKLAVGTAAEIVRSGGKGGTYNALVSDSNVEKLAETLCTMRGAALKLGQMLSIQDEAMIPTKLAAALDRVRENAHVMPKDQLHYQLRTELGEDWRSKFQEFDDVPIAAASIGQVHRATLLNGDRVAIKIQYPGVAESIGSDLLNLKRLVTYTNILPRGLYIDEIIRVGKEELTAECDYLSEADNQERFSDFIQQSGMDGKYVVPRVYRELSTSRILTTQLISGVAVDKAVHLSQDVRNSIARRILELTIHELFNWRFMQTDPNWSNFMYNASTDTVGLVDFGAAREYPKAFVDDYFNIVWAAANEDEKTLVDYSIKMHFLTGDESPGMMRAHIAAGMVVGEPFRSHEPFDFQKSRLTTRLGQHTEVFMHGRLTPPPQEVYSLHRKLAGAFLMCIKLRAVVPCRDVLEEVQRTYSP
ncbi:putative aarF domain-containing protein kinase 4 [Phytophthora boehmeriae]|uniref:Putative aarF domain-containing protein kinase 4 n=1 Tax=Phytophthora boehmeriae TaxID=109152 RepID=A0A8T1WSE8_9STRA|nr:putative aarF domain-containing protein kinase 4 [Phytophthora boehmeriae]